MKIRKPSSLEKRLVGKRRLELLDSGRPIGIVYEDRDFDVLIVTVWEVD